MAKTTSGFNSDSTVRQYAHGLLLESPFVPSSTNRWAVWAKIRQNGRLSGRRAKTRSRNMATTQKINFLTLVSYSLLQTVFRQDIPFRHNTKHYIQTYPSTSPPQGCAMGPPMWPWRCDLMARPVSGVEWRRSPAIGTRWYKWTF